MPCSRRTVCDPTSRYWPLAPGSVWATKRWPSFDALAANIAEDPHLRDHRVVVLGGPGDAPLATAIVDIMRERGTTPAIDATGRLSLLASAALLARARVLVTNDSAPLHLASAMDTPTVALFGPTIPAFGFGPLATRQATLEVGGLAVPAVPCARSATVPAGALALHARPVGVAGARARAPVRGPQGSVTERRFEALPPLLVECRQRQRIAAGRIRFLVRAAR